MTTFDHIKITWKLAFPVVVSQVGHMMVGVADSMMVGRLGSVPLASVSLANGFFSVFLLFGIGVSYGMTPLVASADGSNDKKQAISVFKHGFVLNTFVGVGLIVLAYLSSFLFPYMDQEPEVFHSAIPYYRVISMSLLPLMFYQSFRQFTEGLSLTKQTMVISVAGNILNIVFNYILIFGKLGFEPMGLMGAGWSTFFSRVMMVVALGGYVLLAPRFKKYRAIMPRVDWKVSIMGKIAKIGLPTGFQFVFEVGAFGAAAVMVGWFGAIPLAAHQIALNLSAITYMASTGISAAATIRIGNQLGRKDFKTMQQVGWGSFIMTAVMMALFGSVFIIFRNLLPTLYINEIPVIEVASQLLIIAALFQVSDGLQAIGLGVLRGLRDVKIPTLVTLLSYWVLAIPSGYFLGSYLNYGARGVWMGLLIGLTLAAFLHIARFRYLLRTPLS